MNKDKRSILKKTDENTYKTSGSNKRISFANQSESVEEYKDEDLVAPNLKNTPIGFCYVPPSYDDFELLNNEIPYISMSSSGRADYREVFKNNVDNVSVLIIGDQVISTEFKQHFEQMYNERHNQIQLISKHSWDPSEKDIKEADFFIFLIHMNKFYGISDIRPCFKKVRQVVNYLSHRCIVVGIKSTISPKDEPLPVEYYHKLIVEEQIPSFTFCVFNRERRKHVMKNIIATMLEHRGISSSDPLIKWGFCCPASNEDSYLT